MLTVADVIGLAAGAMTTLSFVPQVAQTWRTRSAGDLSLGMLLTFTLGVCLWLTYGVVLGQIAIIVANAATLMLALTLVFLKIVFRSRRLRANRSTEPPRG
jgi:MtN3 and saliva related transmembrane protein